MVLLLPQPRLRVLVIVTHPLLREGVAAFVEQQPGVMLVGAYASADELPPGSVRAAVIILDLDSSGARHLVEKPAQWELAFVGIANPGSFHPWTAAHCFPQLTPDELEIQLPRLLASFHRP